MSQRDSQITSQAVQLGTREVLRGRRFDFLGGVLHFIVAMSSLASVAVLAVLLANVVAGAWPVLSSRPIGFLTSDLGSKAAEAGLSQAIRGTFWIGAFVVTFSIPIGVAAAVYLEEFARPSKFTRFLDVNVRNLAGVPSVVYGILGLTIFVQAMQSITGPDSNGRSVISAGLTLSALVLPIVIITSAEAIRAVPSSIKEAAVALGATHWEVVRHHVLPYAAPGILTGTVLALARALGEAAPLILVGATTGYLSRGDSYSVSELNERFTALPIAIAEWSGQFQDGFQDVLAPAAIVVLLAIVLTANAGAIVLRSHFENKRK